MSKGKGKTIDYLTEDPYITGQRYCLVTIIGPHVYPKSDVWGIKVRYVGDTMEQMKKMAKQLRKMDPDYNIFIMEVGKFGPLNVSPEQVAENEYIEEQLNEMIKGYLENQELAKQHWHERKNEMLKDAIKEGKNQEDMASKPEHPIAVLQRIKNFQDKLASLDDQLSSLREDLRLSEEKYQTYSEEDRHHAEQELENAFKENKEPSVPNDEQNKSLEELKLELNNLDEEKETSQPSEIDNILSELKSVETELEELNTMLTTIRISDAPNYHKRIQSQIDSLQEKERELREKLQNNQSINQYINSNYTGKSEHESLFV